MPWFYKVKRKRERTLISLRNEWVEYIIQLFYPAMLMLRDPKHSNALWVSSPKAQAVYMNFIKLSA